MSDRLNANTTEMIIFLDESINMCAILREGTCRVSVPELRRLRYCISDLQNAYNELKEKSNA